MRPLYTYLHINETGVFYVGCGSLRRANSRHHRKDTWENQALGGYSVLIVSQFMDQEKAWKREKELIAFFNPSCNRASGGPSSTGFRWPNENKQRLAQKIKESWEANPARKIKFSNNIKGEKNPCAKLNQEQIIKIKQDKRLLRIISEEYGVSNGSISLIRNGKNWRHIEKP